jgi:hypothetical protein
MAIYESVPRTTEAEQFFFSDPRQIKGVCYCREMPPHVHTIHNNQVCELADGDYVIPEPNGVNYYPCKPDIFEKNWRLKH